MIAFPSERIRYLSDPSIYNVNAEPFLDCPYDNMEPELLNDLFDAELETYSEVSIDTTSESSWKYKMNGNTICFQPRNCGESSFMFGSSDGGTMTPFELPEVSRSLSYSDDDVREILSIDKTVIHNRSTLDDIEQLPYFEEFVHNAQYCNEYDSSKVQDLCEYDPNLLKDLYRNMEVARENSSEYYTSERLLYNQMSWVERLRSLALDEEQGRFYGKLQWSDTQKPFVAEGNQRKTIIPELQPNARRGHGKKVANVVQKPLPSTSSSMNGKNKANPCSTASYGEQRIFLGGLPVGMTERSLRQQLSAQGYKVLKRPKILRGFAPEVLMRSVQEAKELVELGTIMINGVEVEVRPFNSLMKQSESRKIPNIKKRSIFLGGLSDSTTARDIQEALAELGIKIVNYPVVKFGFSRQVILETVRQATALIEKKKILINGTIVDVRPFMRQHSRKKSR